MRLFTILPLLTALLVAPASDAAKLTYEVYGDTFAFSLELEPTDPEFETIDFDLKVNKGALVAPQGDANAISDAGDGGTGFNWRLVGIPTLNIGGPFTSFVGTEVSTDRMFQAWTNLHRPVSLPAPAFLAQAQVQAGTSGAAVLQLFRSGDVVGTIETPFGVPEPASLAGLAIAGVLGFRRRR